MAIYGVIAGGLNSIKQAFNQLFGKRRQKAKKSQEYRLHSYYRESDGSDSAIAISKRIRKSTIKVQKRSGQRSKLQRIRRFVFTALATFVLTLQLSGIGIWLTIQPAAAATTIAIEPITWDFVGLDSNKPETQGPNTYVVGARVCNTGTEDALNVRVRFVKDGVDNGFAFIRLQAGDTYTFDRIPASNGTAPILPGSYIFDTKANGALYKSKYQLTSTPQYCQDFYYNFEVTRTPAAWNTYQKYYIEASGSNTNTVRTERPRQSYIEKLISQARNEVFFFGCDSSGGSSWVTGNVTVQVGDTFTCQARAHTATAYPQLSFTADIPNVIFQVLDVNSTYEKPTGGINSTVYADGCGWVADPSDPRYHLSPGACSSETGFPNVYSDQYPYLAPPNEGNGGVGNNIVTTYRIKVISFPNGIPNPIQVSNVILDYSGSSYHYNADYGVSPNIISITVANPNPTDLSVTKTHSDPFSYGDKFYELIVSDNSNLSPAKSPVTLVDTLPTGYTFIDQDPVKSGIQPLSGTDASKWNCNTSGQVMTCLYDINGDGIGENFPDGGTNTLTLNVNIPTSIPSGTTSTNFAQVSLNSAQTDSNLANNKASDPTTVLAGVDIVLTKDDNVNDPTEETFNAGSTATYRITASNNSGSNANGPLTLVDTLPTGFKFTGTYSGTNNGTAWSCSATDATGAIVICTNTRGLNNGETTTINLTVNVLQSAEDMNPGVTGIQAINTATITSTSNEINSTNNTATQTNNVSKPAPDLVVSKTDNNIEFIYDANNPVTSSYFITVTNQTGANVITTT
ncbi:MAG: hypothetical protein VKJ46_13825, partial [Leptolyngbyaceae bacterium]|nr:hypothetical protein [Leptolyngbyaceae bacterium]